MGRGGEGVCCCLFEGVFWGVCVGFGMVGKCERDAGGCLSVMQIFSLIS